MEAHHAGLLCSAHDCSDGGLAVAPAECCIWSDLGLAGDMPAGIIPLSDPLTCVALLYGEAPSRIVVSLTPDAWPALAELAAAAKSSPRCSTLPSQSCAPPGKVPSRAT